MILVTGATGHLGKATIDHLLKSTSASNIVALARDEAKATPLRELGVKIALGTYDDTAALERAMQGVEKVLLISGLDPNRLEQHKNVVDAAKKAGVAHIAYTGIPMKDMEISALKQMMESHFQTEDYIKASGMTYTFLRNTLYTDDIPMFVGEKVLETGIHLPAGSGKVPYALRREMGEAAANILLQSEHENQVYDITGTELYSFQDVARELSQLSGKAVTYTDSDADTLAEQLKVAGVPEMLIMLALGFSADIKNHQFEELSQDLEQLLGRKPASLSIGLKELYQL